MLGDHDWRAHMYGMLAVFQNSLSLSVLSCLCSFHYNISFCISTFFSIRDCLLREGERKTPGWARPVISHMKLRVQRWMVSSRSRKSFITNCGVARSVAGALQIRSGGIAKAIEEVLCPE